MPTLGAGVYCPGRKNRPMPQPFIIEGVDMGEDRRKFKSDKFDSLSSVF